MEEEFSIAQYTNLVKSFINAKYQFRKFDDTDGINGKPYVIFRHDVDFSLEAAVEIGKIEAALEVYSTFFVQLRSPLYNVLCSHSVRCIEALHNLGHDIALHFDFHIYKDNFVSSILKEIDTLAGYYPFVNRGIVSIHRLGNDPQFLQNIQLPDGIRHTYEHDLFKHIKYYSDSTGRWRFGHPVKSEAFNHKLPMQVLTHPVWWVYGNNHNQPLDKLQEFVKKLSELTIDHIQETAVTFNVDRLRDNQLK